MKTIEIDKGGYGIASLFDTKSTKKNLIQKSSKSIASSPAEFWNGMSISQRLDFIIETEASTGETIGHSNSKQRYDKISKIIITAIDSQFGKKSVKKVTAKTPVKKTIAKTPTKKVTAKTTTKKATAKTPVKKIVVEEPDTTSSKATTVKKSKAKSSLSEESVEESLDLLIVAFLVVILTFFSGFGYWIYEFS